MRRRIASPKSVCHSPEKGRKEAGGKRKGCNDGNKNKRPVCNGMGMEWNGTRPPHRKRTEWDGLHCTALHCTGTGAHRGGTETLTHKAMSALLAPAHRAAALTCRRRESVRQQVRRSARQRARPRPRAIAAAPRTGAANDARTAGCGAKRVLFSPPSQKLFTPALPCSALLLPRLTFALTHHELHLTAQRSQVTVLVATVDGFTGFVTERGTVVLL